MDTINESNNQLDVVGLDHVMQATTERLTDLVLEYDDLLLQQKPHIEAQYAVQVGSYETECLRMENEYLRARRKLALVMQSVNLGEVPDEEHIEKQLDEEHREWEVELGQRLATIQASIAFAQSSKELSAAEADELKRLYRTLSKRLHPDINPDQAETDKAWLQQVQVAYASGDLTILRSIEVATRHLATIKPVGLAPGLTMEEALQKEIDSQVASIELVSARIAVLLEQYPFCVRDLLADKNRVAEVVAQLEEQTEIYGKLLEETLVKIVENSR